MNSLLPLKHFFKNAHSPTLRCPLHSARCRMCKFASAVRVRISTDTQPLFCFLLVSDPNKWVGGWGVGGLEECHPAHHNFLLLSLRSQILDAQMIRSTLLFRGRALRVHRRTRGAEDLGGSNAVRCLRRGSSLNSVTQQSIISKK